jgi:hypothetical protein
VQTALHQDFAHARLNELDGLFGRSIAMRRIDDFDTVEIQFVVAGDRRDLCGRSHQNWHNKISFGSLHCAAQRSLVAGMNDENLGRLNSLSSGDQALVLGMRL